MVSIDARSGSSTVALSVRDMGAGMSASDLEQVARPFRQGSNAKGRAGTGLGLAITESAVRQHNGTIKASKSELGGLKITISLPVEVSGLKKSKQP